MSMKEFFEGECGQLNPILKVASHFTQDVSLRESLAAGSGVAAAAAYAAAGTSYGASSAQQFGQGSHPEVSLLPPTTFRMDSLLEEIQSMEQPSQQHFQRGGPVQGPSVTALASHSDWAAEFLKNEQNVQVGGAAWAGEYFAAELDPVWDKSREMYSLNGNHNNVQQIRPMDSEAMQMQSPQEFLDSSKWASEYEGQTELMMTAEEFLKSVSDPTIKATDFMGYVEKLSTGEIKSASAMAQEVDSASQSWADEYDFQFGSTSAESDWTQNFAGQEDLGPGIRSAKTTATAKEDFWHKMEDEWERLAQEEASSHPWLTETSVNDLLNQEYKFNESNPFQEIPNALEEGKRRLRDGDIPSAVLAFEAAVQQTLENPEGWLLLGSTQAQNEQDTFCISALNQCLQLDPNNLTALMTLAASLTNESYQLQACNALKSWLRANPKYSNVFSDDMLLQDTPRASSLLPAEELTKVQKAFMRVARLNPHAGVDADVQSGLGILFNLSSDYERAADCFNAALQVRPGDSLLWNRMGATLANGGKSTEAIAAYRRALEISPGFIRTRYNLGISCVNLGAYREAAEHFLSSLNQQAAGKPVAHTANSKSNVVSNSIWSSLRMILHLMDRSELSPAVDSRDLARLNREFGMH